MLTLRVKYNDMVSNEYSLGSMFQAFSRHASMIQLGRHDMHKNLVFALSWAVGFKDSPRLHGMPPYCLFRILFVFGKVFICGEGLMECTRHFICGMALRQQPTHSRVVYSLMKRRQPSTGAPHWVVTSSAFTYAPLVRRSKCRIFWRHF